MARPRPTWAYHFTHVTHLASIARDGLVCDSRAHVAGRLTREVGNHNLMLYQLHTGQVPTYDGGQAGLVFLCTTLERVIELNLPWVVSDRNAAKALATFTCDPDALDTHVSWDVATMSTSNRTEGEPDRPERHQAELLVHRRVPWEAIQFVGTRTSADLAVVQEALTTLGGRQPRRDVRPRWYF